MPASTGKNKHRWLYWACGALALLLLALAGALLLLDPWLQRTLEQQVATQSQGRYQLRIGELHTSLWHRSVLVQHIRLRPAKADSQWHKTTLPHLLTDIEQLRITGIGLRALLRGSVVPIDSVVLAGGRVRVLQLPEANTNAQPLHEQLPKRLAGLRVGYLGLGPLQAAYGPARRPEVSVRQIRLAAHDILLTAAGAADSQRVSYAAAFEAQLVGSAGTAANHRLLIGKARFSSQSQRLTVDSVRVRSLLDVRRQGAVVRVNLQLPQLRLTGIRSAELRRKQLRLDSLVLVEPRLTAAPPVQPPPALHTLLAPYFSQVRLAQLRVSNGTLRLTGIPNKPTFQEVKLLADDVLLTAAGARDAARIWYARSWELRTGRVQSTVSAPVYWLGIRSTELVTRTGLVRANGITLRPTMTPNALARYKQHQTPHITVRAVRAQISGLDFAALAHRGSLLARHLDLRRLRVHIKGDGRFPLNPKASLVTQESLARLPMRLNVRRLTLTDTDLATSYIGPTTNRQGNITFNRINVTLTNLTNDPRLMTAATPLVGTASGWLQNSWSVRVKVRIPLLDPAGRHSGEGTFGPGSITLLNSMTEPTRLVRFESGDVRRATVRFQANRQQITGTMQAEYTNLKLTLLSQQGGPDQKTLLTKIGSKLLNGLVVRDENPRSLGPDRLKVGSLQSRRDLRVSVFSLWRQGLVSGLLNSIGAPKKVAQTISEQP
ncbi:hypothetical protein [Hymenobacter lucidus]|uniref:hypothetical protein n=1 Tax=Hymenobacter lucidus TaxID=2880930 RepID=UPI001CF50C69|nr:hypothetical protein [Hymenobacter lucidus]